jgi:hypothetical protein
MAYKESFLKKCFLKKNSMVGIEPSKVQGS